MAVYCIRHGETEWSLSGQHTGRTDIPLTENGRKLAVKLQSVLGGKSFALVLTSPLQRAQETCRLVGLGAAAVVDADLREWDYGAYEGLTPAQIHALRPGWMLFRDGSPGGESPAEIGARVDRLIERIRAVEGDVALFAHGHVLRVLGARWIGQPVEEGCRLLLDTGTISIIGDYRGTPAIRVWNCAPN